MGPKIVVDTKIVLGEGPVWHPLEEKLYWLDIDSGSIFRYDPKDGNYERVYQGEAVGGYTIQQDGSLVLFMNKGAVKIWRDGELRTVFDDIPEERDTRFNDVIADPEGRIFCGTMPGKDHPASLYRLDPDGTLTKVLENVTLSNGMGFTPDRKQMYFTDTYIGKIYLFDYDRASGNLSNQRVFATIPKAEGFPDGMTVDAEGYVWSARWDGGCIVRYAPDGKEVQRSQLPAKKVTSMTFGGQEYQDMYITTAGGDRREENGPGSGALFHMIPDVPGVPEFFSRIGL